METLPSGIKKYEGTDAATKDNFNINAELLNNKINEVDNHIAATEVHGATSTSIANRIPIRDSAAQFNVGTPTAASHVATKAYVDVKANSASPTFTGTVTLPSTTSIGNVSSTEIGYLDGATSNLQTQLNAKAPSASPTFTGTPTVPNATVGTNTTQAASTAFVQTAIANSGHAKVLGGTYTGNDAATRDIAIPFNPIAVFVFPQNSSGSWFSSNGGGLAIPGSPSKSGTTSPVDSVTIGTNKFTVYYVVSKVGSNLAGVVYNWIAIG